MRILNTYSQNNLYYSKHYAFKGSAIPMSADAISRLPERTQALIRKAQLEKLAKGTSQPEQQKLAGVIPQVTAHIKGALAITRRHKGAPVLDSTHQKLTAALEELEQAQQVLPTPKASIKVPNGVAPELAEMSAQRTPRYNDLNRSLTEDGCTIESVQEILKGGLLKPVPKEHRFELVEKMLDVAIKRKSPELVGKLFNYVFKVSNHWATEGQFGVNKEHVANVDCISALMKFFNAGMETGNAEVLKASYTHCMSKSKGFNNDLNNMAIDFAAEASDVQFAKMVLIETEKNFDEAKLDKDKLAKVIERYINADIPKNINETEPPFNIEFINALIFRLPNKLRQRIRANVASDLETKVRSVPQSKKTQVLKWYFTPARK